MLDTLHERNIHFSTNSNKYSVLRTPDGIYVALSLHLCLLQHKDSNTHTHSLFFVNQIMMCAQKVSMIRANRGKKSKKF